jgi:hypothetical protein
MADNLGMQALGMAAGGIAGGVVQAGLGVYQMYQGRKDLQAARAEIEALKTNAPSLAVPSAYTDFYKKAMDRSNLEFQTQQIAMRQAANVSALSKAGGRALVGGLGSVTQQSAADAFKAQQAQFEREMQASQVYGGAQQQAQQLQEGRYRMELGMADQARQSAQANIAAGLGAAASGAIAAGGAYSDAYSQLSQQQAERLGMSNYGRSASNLIGLGLPKINPNYKYTKSLG